MIIDKRRRREAKVAFEALSGDRTLQEIASQHQVHPIQVDAWKRRAIEGLRREEPDTAVIGEALATGEAPFEDRHELPGGGKY